MTSVAVPSPGVSSGLSTTEAATLLEAEGFNELPSAKARRPLRLFLQLLQEPMIFLLLGCGIIYMILGDRQEAGMLLGFLGLSLGITFYQEYKTERALDSLRDLSSPRALVLRDGHQVRIPGREVVRGDLVFLAEGDRVPADGDVIASVNLAVDESLLTGESMPVLKPAGKSRVFGGTTAVKGSAVVRTTATGPRTELGRIGSLLHPKPQRPTRLQHETRKLVRVVASIAAVLSVVVVLATRLYGHSWLDASLVGLTLAMALLPNELPAVLAIFLALGAWRLSRRRVLTRRVATVEALGTATVLCVDKTGTLTYNRMAIRELVAGEHVFDVAGRAGEPLPEELHEVLEFGLLAAEPNPYDPMDRAFTEAAALHLAATEHLHPDWILARQYPLSPELLALSQAWAPGREGPFPVAAKGAPEAIAELCRLPAPERAVLARRVEGMAARGLRVLGVAKGRSPLARLPESQRDIAFDFVGLVGLEDPVRAEVPAAVDECRRAGIRVVMITGDHPRTARSIARQVGLGNPDAVLTGAEIDRLAPEELAERLRLVDVCARTVPEQKARLVEALKASGEIVAMTGDGVNDAPALKRADIGIAMGQRGTDVAREASSLVLLDDDFGSIVGAVATGRRIYANLEHAMSYLLAVHVPIAGLSVIPVLFDLPLILLPIHIAFLQLLIEPASSVAFEAEAEAPDVMRRPPRPPEQRLYSWRVLRPTLVQGFSVLAILLAVFVSAYRWGEGEADARTLAFTSLVAGNLGLIVASLMGAGGTTRRRQANRALRWVIVGSLVMLALVLYVPSVREAFRFTHMHPNDLILCAVAGLGSSLWFFLLRKGTAQR